MKRRTFVRNAALGGLGLSLPGLYGCSNPNNREQSTGETEPFFKLSLAQWSIHKMIREDGMDPYDFALKAKGWDFEALEYVNQLYMTKDESMGDGASFSSDLNRMIAELKKRSEDQGMKNLLMMLDLADGPGDMAVTDQKARRKAVDAHKRWIDATAELGCESARINMFGDLDPENWKAAAIDSLGELGEYAAERNVNVLMENHGWLTSNPPLVAEVLDQVQLKNCGTLPDFDNFCMKRIETDRWGGECVDEYDRYQGIMEMMPYAMGVSAKSHDFDEAGNETTIDYTRMLKIVKDAGFKGYIGVEFEGPNMKEEDGILATKALLLKVAAELAA